MLDKARNNLISNAFRKANITSIESEPTAVEIEDAAHNLNVMLQSWNNDGFRLFKIKTGYMPFIPETNEYALATQAYKSFELTKTFEFEKIGATKLYLEDISNLAVGQKIVVVNNTVTPARTVAGIIYSTDKVESSNSHEYANVILNEYLPVGVNEGDSVFYGSFSVATTEVKVFDASFDTISYNNQEVMPVIGDYVYLQYENRWTRRQIVNINATARTITLDGVSFSAGKITSEIIVYGSAVYMSSLNEGAPVEPRKLKVKALKEIPTYISIIGDDDKKAVIPVESVNKEKTEIILKEPVSASVLKILGEDFIDAKIVYPATQEMKWPDLSGLIPPTEMDWGSITDSSSLVTDDWGNIQDAATVLEDWGTLSGTATQVGFSKSNGGKYSLLQNSQDETYTLAYNAESSWSLIDIESYSFVHPRLYTVLGKSYLMDEGQGLFLLENGELNSIFSGHGVETIIFYQGLWYLVSAKGSGISRAVSSTKDFVTFTFMNYINLDSVANPVEFKEKLFISSTDTYVGDMKSFYNIGVFSQSRCVIGDRMLNLNTAQNCSYTLDGIKFSPMPVVLSNESAWGYKDGCSFIAIYGVLNEGVVSTQIFTANDFNPVWTPQVIVPGKVFDIFFDDENAYFVSDVAAVSLKIREAVKPYEPAQTLCFGEQIGRPQEIMNVVKYGFENQVELPMNAVSLKEFSILPHSGQGGTPVNYCFFRDAIDGKMMVWGTPKQFGEYLRFSYVEPLTLLEDARSTPDFPDEYYEAVEDGLAAELAISYGLPIERQQALIAKAEESKEKAMLHDNEDTTYNIVPNQRW